MAHFIETVCEPKMLYLAWQSPDLHGPDRFRWAVGVVQQRGADFTLRYFDRGSEFESFNQGRSFERLEKLGYSGYPAFVGSESEYKDGVRTALMRRVPPRHRTDFADYLRQFHLRPDRSLSDLALLARTEATLPSDGFSLVDPLDGDTSHCEVLLEVAGFRHYAKGVSVAVGDPVEIVRDPTNPYDCDAVEFRTAGTKIGNVNRLQTGAFHNWLERAHVEAWLERLNGTEERPRAFVFVRVTPAERLAAA